MYRSGPGMVDLHGAPFSAAVSVCTTREAWKHERLQHQSTGYLRTRGQEALYEHRSFIYGMRLPLHVHFSVTSEESLGDSEPPLNGYPSTKGQETS